MTDSQSRLSSLVKLLGEERVLVDEVLLSRYGRSDTTKAERPIAVVRPRSREELASIVRVANSNELSVHPISRGENWGYGAGAPVLKAQVLLDLRDLTAIEVNEELAYAVVEPGVTQAALAEYLARQHPNLILDCTGAPGSTSIIGNVMERGVGFMPGGRAANVAGLEVVTAEGSLISLGFGAYGARELGHSRKGTLGPDLEGLFMESNLGIVARLGLWLRPRPEVIKTYWIGCHDRADFLRLLLRFRDLWLREGWASVARGGQLNPELHDLGGVVYGSRRYADAFEASLRKVCSGVAEVLFLTPGTADWEEHAAREIARFNLERRSPLLARLGPVSALAARAFAGRAKQRHLFELVTRRAKVMAGTPQPSGAHIPLERDERELGEEYRFAQLWIAPVCPFTEAHVTSCLAILESVMQKHQVELFVESTPILGGIEWIITDPRSVILLVSLGFERGAPIEERALACYHELWDTLHAAGYISYRSGIQAMHKLRHGADAYWDLVGKLKHALDPNATIAPGRYSPDEAAKGPFA